MDTASPPGDSRPRLATRSLTVFLFLTGGSALIYQVVWTRYLGLLLGSSAVAVVVVLAAFMGGLAIGSWAFGRLADRPIRRLTLYGWLELGVGLYCVLFPLLLQAASGPYLALVTGLSQDHPTAFTAARLSFAAVLLLPPTVLMGGTLPAATRYLIGLAPGVRSAVGRLYWVNSAGAVVGALLAGFVLIPSLGLDLTLDLAAGINICVAAGALALRRKMGEDPTALPASDPGETPLSARATRAALVAVTISGFAGLAVEVAWTRLFALSFGGSTYAFTLMVACFILGISLGSRAVSRPGFGRGDPLLWLSGALGLAALSLAATTAFYPSLPWLTWWLRSLLSSSQAAFPVFHGMLFLTAAAVMLIPTVAMGATLPLAARITASGHSVGSRVGLTWAVNTAGTLLGAILAGLVFLPRLGLQRTFALVVACYAVASLVVLLGVEARSRRRALAVAVPCLVALGLVALQSPWSLAQLNSGSYRERTGAPTYRSWMALGLPTVLFARDGATTSVMVSQVGKERFLRVNGKTDATLRGDLNTQLLLAHLPAFLAPPSATRALVIGMGSGATVGALVAHPGLQVTAVEIEPAVVEAARSYFGEVNRGVLEGHRRVEVLIEDAKTVFQRGGPAYDIIVSEPSNPWLAGIGGLFSQEFFEAARSRLAPDGVMAQWLQTYELDNETLSLVLRTFRGVFPEVTVWQPQEGDFILLGSARPMALDVATLARRFEPAEVKRSLLLASVDSVAGLLARQALSSRGTALAAGSGPVNTDQFPVLEYNAPRGFFVGRAADRVTGLDERLHAMGRRDLLLHQFLGPTPSVEAVLSVARSAGDPHPELLKALLARSAAMAPDDGEPARRLLGLYKLRSELRSARELYLQHPRLPDRDGVLADLDFRLAIEDCQRLRNGVLPALDCSEAIRLGEALKKGGPKGADPRAAEAGLARAYLWSGRGVQALAAYRGLLAGPAPLDAATETEYRTGEAAALLLLQDRVGARAAAMAALRVTPTFTPATRVLAAASD